MQLRNLTAPNAMASLGSSVNPFATTSTVPAGGSGILSVINNGLQSALNLYGQYETIQALKDAGKQTPQSQVIYVPEPQAQAKDELPKWLIPAGITAAGLLLVVAMTRPKGRRR